jgi:tetratricopeptide (TPR) repeat protein
MHDPRLRRPFRTVLLGSAAAAFLLAGPVPGMADDAKHGTLMLAQAQAPAMQHAPRHAGTGPFAQDLPRGAAAPTSDERPPIYGNFGNFGWPGASTNRDAQALFDQGYRFAYAFNHGEAVRNFRAAQQLDPDCALCFWGEAWALGPNINYFMEPDANARALAVLEQARRLAPQAGEKQAALIEALSQRHSPDTQADRAALDRTYAEAMQNVQRRFPDDPHLAVLTADALMNTQPWDYWADGGRTPKGNTEAIVALLEGVLGERQGSPIRAMPDHPGAIHLYIHTVEASDRPERAVQHAERLEALMPGAGHIVHMPSHIWLRLGRWRDTLEANRRAVAANEALIAKGGQSLLLSEAYYPHNIHFLVQAAMMGGDGPTAVQAAEKLAQRVSARAQREIPWVQPIAAAPYLVHARFSTPEIILSIAPPDERFPFTRAHWHYARGVALARLGRTRDAAAEVAAIQELAQAPQIAELEALAIPAGDILAIAAHVVSGRVAQQAGDHVGAAAQFRQAAERQDRLPYMEPPYWHYPVHQ